MTDISNFLAQSGLGISLPDEIAGNIGEPADPVKGDLKGDANIPLLGQVLKLSKSLDGELSSLATGASIALNGTTYTPADGQAFASLDLNGDVTIDGSGSQSAGEGISLSFTTKNSATASYNHIMSFPPTQARLDAYLDLAKRARLPQLLNPKLLRDGELQALTLDCDMSLGLTANYGYARDLHEELFGGLKLAVTGSLSGAFEASLGLGIKGRFEYVLERISPSQPGWVRASLKKTHEHSISLGATVNITMTYDLGTGLITMIDQVLQTEPVTQLRDAINRVNANEDFALIAEGKWDELESKYSAKMTACLQAYLQPYIAQAAGALNTEQVAAFVGDAAKLLQEYANLNNTLNGLWDKVLGYANLQTGSSFRQALKSIGRLNDEDPDGALSSLLKGDSANAVELLEQLTGKSLEDLILDSSDNVASILKKAAENADKILGVIEATPSDVLAKIQAFAKSTGIQSTVDWLNKYIPEDGNVATFINTLETQADVFVKDNVSKLTQKAFNLLNEDDLHELSSFATRIRSYIQDANDSVEKLKKAAEQLKGEVGITLVLEWERVVTRARVVDIEFNPGSCDGAIDALSKGRVAAFLKALPGERDRGEPNYQLNQCLLTDTQVNTSAVTLLISLLGKTKNSNRREVSSSINIQEEEGQAVRKGTYRGTYTRILETGENNDLWQSSVSLSAEGRVAGKALSTPYPKLDWGLALTVQRNDSKTEARELQSTLRMLQNLGFHNADDKILSSGIGPNLSTKTAIRISLGQDAVDALLSEYSEEEWDETYINAGFYWFDTQLTTWGKDYVGHDLAKFVVSPAYTSIFANANNPMELNAFLDTPVIDGKTIKTWKSMLYLAQEAAGAEEHFSEAIKKSNAALENPVSKAITKACKAFTLTAKRTMPYQDLVSPNWNSPMFPVYQVLSLLSVVQPSVLNNAKGVATFSWANAENEWQNPIELIMEDGMSLPLMYHPS